MHVVIKKSLRKLRADAYEAQLTAAQRRRLHRWLVTPNLTLADIKSLAPRWVKGPYAGSRISEEALSQTRRRLIAAIQRENQMSTTKPVVRGDMSILLRGQAMPDGNGGYIVKPGKPIAECSSAEAAKILGVKRTSLSLILNYPIAQKLLRWRWTSEACGKRMFEVDSVYAYRQARSRDRKFGGHKTHARKR